MREQQFACPDHGKTLLLFYLSVLSRTCEIIKLKANTKEYTVPLKIILQTNIQVDSNIIQWGK